MAGHFTVCAFTLGSKRLRQVFIVYSLQPYRLYLSMCNLYLIREHNCTSCTYSVAPSEQLRKSNKKDIKMTKICWKMDENSLNSNENRGNVLE